MKRTGAQEASHQMLEQSARILGLDDETLDLLRHPSSELHVSIPVRMDNGKLRVFRGYHVQHNTSRGPARGGIRFHPNETIEWNRALAAGMTWKCALLDLPIGGASGGVVCAPKQMSPGELERLSRAYVGAIWRSLGPGCDVLAPDVYTDGRIITWMRDEYARLAGQASPPGGALREDATARGGVVVIREAARRMGLDMKNATAAIQGFGKVGRHMARILRQELGVRIVAVSDSRGGAFTYQREGLDPDAVLRHKLTTGSVVQMQNTVPKSNDELLELDVDLLIPCALENVITVDNAPRVRARILVEMASSPTAPGADGLLEKNRVHVIPDLLANAGGVTASYLDSAQRGADGRWDEAGANRALDEKMAAAYHSVAEAAQRLQAPARLVAFAVAVERVVASMKAGQTGAR